MVLFVPTMITVIMNILKTNIHSYNDTCAGDMNNHRYKIESENNDNFNSFSFSVKRCSFLLSKKNDNFILFF